jgi:hypothetical protein
MVAPSLWLQQLVVVVLLLLLLLVVVVVVGVVVVAVVVMVVPVAVPPAPTADRKLRRISPSILACGWRSSGASSSSRCFGPLRIAL